MIKPETIVGIIAKNYGVGVNDILSRRMSKAACEAKACCYIALLRAGYSGAYIAAMLGKNHSTVSVVSRKWRTKLENVAADVLRACGARVYDMNASAIYRQPLPDCKTRTKSAKSPDKSYFGKGRAIPGVKRVYNYKLGRIVEVSE